VTAREMERRRLPDRCEQCGRFVGYYPAGFYCDRHCAACACGCCPGVDGPTVATGPYFPDTVNNEGETWWVRLDLAHQATEIVRSYHLEGHLVRMGRDVMVPGPGFWSDIGYLYVADSAEDHQEAAVYVRFEDEAHEYDWFDGGARGVCRVCGDEA
jgi:hypothetical protein